MADVVLDRHAARVAWRWPALAALLLAAVALRLLVGAQWSWPDGDWVMAILRATGAAGLMEMIGLPSLEGPTTVLELRLARVVLAAAVGAALAGSGVALQALLRNPLAEPFVLGLSSGAAVGVMAQALLAYALGVTLGQAHWGAVAGALVSVSIVFLAGRRRGMIDPLGLLLVGVVLATLNGAVVMSLNYAVGPGGLRDDLARWMMGSLNESLGAGALVATLVLTVAGAGALWRLGLAMDAASFSDAEAWSLGVHLGRLRLVLLLVASVLAAGAVVLAGPVAFVGLIGPHLARLVVGPRHRPLVVASVLLGAALVILADAASSMIDVTTGIGRLPIGIFTAVLGGPVFIAMLRPRMGRG